MHTNPSPTDAIDSDVLIVGAGPAGLALSVALAQGGLRSTVLEQCDAQTLAQPSEDGRDIALTHRARRILETLGIWQRLPADEIAPLRKAHVSNGVSPLVLPFDAEGDGHEALGWLVPNHRLREAAYAVASETPGSWWPHWIEWLRSQDSAEVPANGKRVPGSKGDLVIEDAPGRYVKSR